MTDVNLCRECNRPLRINPDSVLFQAFPCNFCNLNNYLSEAEKMHPNGSVLYKEGMTKDFGKMPEQILVEKLLQKAVKELTKNLIELACLSADELYSYQRAKEIVKSISEEDDYIGILRNAGEKITSDIHDFHRDLGEKIMDLLIEDIIFPIAKAKHDSKG